MDVQGLALQVTACVFLFQAVVIAASTINTAHISGCHNNNIMLNCPLYQKAKSESDSVELEWKYREKRWKKLTTIDRDGNRSDNSNMSRYQDRLTLHSNGSMMIASLKPDDERMYLCKVGVDGSTKHYLVKLNVTCTGKVTVIKREVCVEEDVVLECEAKHRTNPRKLKRVTWHKKNSSSSTSAISWSPVIDSDGRTVKNGDGFRMSENGSLFLGSGVRDASKVMYRCEVSKNVDSPREIHVVVLKNIKCGLLKRQSDEPSVLKVCTGHQAQLVCPYLTPVNISHVRSVKWHARREGSSKHFHQLFHVKVKKTSNGTVFSENLVRNTTRLHEGVEMGRNGSLLIKSVRSVNGGDYECIVKIRHRHEAYKHLIRLKPIVCNDSRTSGVENDTFVPTPSIPRPINIRTTAGREAITTAPTNGLNGSKTTHRASSKNPTKGIPGLSGTSAHQINRTSNGREFLPAHASRKQATIKSSTSTSTWTVMKPSLQTIKTSTRVTTYTTYSSGSPEEGEAIDLSKEWPVGAQGNGNLFACGGVLNTSAGSFQSPNFPGAYPANCHCKWTISLPQDYAAINVTFHQFDLENEEHCRRDHVAIYDELGNQVGPRHCGIMGNAADFQVKGRVAVIVFRSDGTLQKTGFKLSFKGVKKP